MKYKFSILVITNIFCLKITTESSDFHASASQGNVIIGSIIQEAHDSCFPKAESLHLKH